MKLIFILFAFLLTSCSFIERHLDLLDDVEKIEKRAVDHAADDIKKEIDKQR